MKFNKISIFIFTLVFQLNLSAMFPGGLTYEQSMDKERKEKKERTLLREKINDLIENKKNLNDFSKYSKTRFCFDIETDRFKQKVFTSNGFPLLQAVSLNDFDSIELLLEKGVDVNRSLKSEVGDRLETAMHLAARKGYNQLMPFLIKNGAGVNVVNDLLQTPLHLSITSEWNRVYTIEFLIKNGAKINIADEDGITPLMVAVENLLDDDYDFQKNKGKFVIVKLLILNGADYDAVDRNGRKIIDFIKDEADKKEYLEVLIEYKNQLKSKLLEGTCVSQDPIGIVVEYLVNM